MIDTAAGDDIPRKRGLGMLQADLLVVNKIDLAPHVGADLERMRRTSPSRAPTGRRCSPTCAPPAGRVTSSRSYVARHCSPERPPAVAPGRGRAAGARGSTSRRAGARDLRRRSQRFPLRLTAPLYLDPAQPQMAFVYVQNPTGGMFEGDGLIVSVDACPGQACT